MPSNEVLTALLGFLTLLVTTWNTWRTEQVKKAQKAQTATLEAQDVAAAERTQDLKVVKNKVDAIASDIKAGQ